MSESDPARLVVLTVPAIAAAVLALTGRDARPLARRLPYLLTGGSGALSAAFALAALLHGREARLASWAATPYATLSFRLDPLGAYFLLIVGASVAVVSLYAVSYTAHTPGHRGWSAAVFAAFALSLELLVLADSTLAFLLLWEMMSLTSFFLVVTDHRSADVRQAGLIYLVMTHVGTAFLLGSFFLLSLNAGSLEFPALRTAGATLDATPRAAVFLFALAGFGAKAGIIPLHVWLPRAHPAAPSHVSALMSGVMIKMGIFGLLRVAWQCAGPAPAWWGWLLLALGVSSAVLGVLYALMEHDLKRLLAFSSIENSGIILIGMGVAFVARSAGQRELAALALTAALLHVLNHAAFKGLLFLGAGAIQQACHTRNLERLGGLIRRMPWTAATFLAGAAAIAALPLLNGFISEWLTFQSLLTLGTSDGELPVALAVAISAALLGMTAALAAAGFVKAFGTAFLAQPRGEGARTAHEAPPTMRAAMVILALLCAAIGIAPAMALRLLRPVTDALTGSAARPAVTVGPGSAALSAGLAPLIVVTLVVALALLGALLGRLLGGPRRVRVAPTWVCGVPLEPAMQYSSAAMVKPIRVIFRALLRPYREVELRHSIAPFFVTGVRYHAGIAQTYERHVYQPVLHALLALAHRIRLLQNGNVRVYLAYMCATLVVTLLLVTR